ncbi:GNAT family N-acetyltransferase [Paracoccaceae bacterium]
MSDVTFRDLHGMREFRAAEDLQRAVWGEGDLPDPADLMMVIQAEGGLVGGAFAEGRLLGYIFGFPTRTPQVQHSHRLAVLVEARGMGLGLRLKQYQRDWCLARGITHVRWTFDPLRATNAALNIHRLGARATTYLVDYYGEMEGINRGIPSDRLMADWYLNDPCVAAIAAGARLPSAPASLRLPIPADITALLASDPAQAHQVQAALRADLQAAFAEGLAITDFDSRDCAYLLSETSLHDEGHMTA